MSPQIDEMLMIEPPAFLAISGTACFVPRKTPVELTSMIWVQLSNVWSATVLHALCAVCAGRLGSRPETPAIFASTLLSAIPTWQSPRAIASSKLESSGRIGCEIRPPPSHDRLSFPDAVLAYEQGDERAISGYFRR